MASTTAPTVIEPPRIRGRIGPLAWLRKNLFRSLPDTLLSIVVAVFLVSVLSRFVQWATGEAKWAVITRNLRVLMQGLYPLDQGWRVTAAVIVIMLLAGVSAGIWGRRMAATVVTLLIAVIVFVLV